MIELLEKCVRIPSLSGQEQRVAEFLRDEMLARGFDQAFIDESGSAVGIIGNGPRQLVMLGHMDTVGGDVPVRYEDNKLYGRGTVDAKGPLCAFILAASEAHEKIANSQWQIIVIGATEEEAASSRGAHYAATQYKPELCIIGEPSGSDGITLGYKGRLLLQAHFVYEIQHTSKPGASAGEVAVNFWNWIKDFTNQYNTDKPKVFDQILPALRSIQSSDDGLHEWCDMLIGLRLPVEFGYREASELFADKFIEIELTGALDRATAGFREEGPKQVNTKGSHIEFRGQEQAYRSSKDTVLARAFVDAIREEKLRPAFKVKSGTADFNILGPAWACPIVAYGPGDSDLDHTPNEHVEIDEFERGVRVLARVLHQLTA